MRAALTVLREVGALTGVRAALGDAYAEGSSLDLPAQAIYAAGSGHDDVLLDLFG